MSNINPCFFQRMNTRRTLGQRRGGGAAGGNQVQPQDQNEGVDISVNPTRLTDTEVRASLAEMAQSITMQDQDMTDHVNQQNV